MTALLLALCCAAPVQDEPGDGLDWARALEKLDLSVSWGDFSAELHADLELELLAFGKEAPGVSLEDPVLRSNRYGRTRQEDGPEGVGRLTIVLDGAFEEWLSFDLETRIDHGAPSLTGGFLGARLEQYWVRFTVPKTGLLNLELGRFAAPVGNFIPRSAPRKDPLVTFPVMYDQVTTFMRKTDTAANILGRRNLPAVKDWRVPIYRELYGIGGMVFGTWEKLSYAFAVMNSAPGSWVFEWPLHTGDFQYPNFYAHLSYAFDASLSVGASASRGPYDRADAAGIPVGMNTGDFPQTLAGMDVHYAIGALDIFAEAYWTRFVAPLVDPLELWSWYVEAKYTFLPGLFGALRFAQMIYGTIRDALNVPNPWDWDLTRIEFGGGYFFTRNFFVKGTMQLNYTAGGREPHDNLFILQLGLGF